MNRLRLIFCAICLLSVSACTTNPVTGDKELALVSESSELEIGRKQYVPSRQMQGGDYTADPQLTRYVNQVGQRLASVSDRKLPYDFAVLNNSVPNAWALPGGKIALNRGLLVELDNEAELAAVLGHEVVHAAARHGAQGMERGMILQGAVMAAGVATDMATQDNRYSALAIGGASLAANLINHKYGRDAERESDLYGMEYMKRAGYDPGAAVTLQQTFVRLSKERRQDWLSGLFASHPPSQERVDNNRATAKRLGSQGGDLGRDRYQKAIAHLKKTQPAYAAFDKGVKALKAGNQKQALKLADKALQIEPREAKFYALRGDVRYAQKRYKSALDSYNKALSLNPQYFAFYTQRGLTKKQLGDLSGAKQDLAKSAKLLPTAVSYNGLGQLALAAGDRRRAKEYFRQASSSKTGPGKEALQSLIELDLPENPGRYLQTSVGTNRNGDVLAYVANPTHVPLRDVKIAVRYLDKRGRSHQWSHSVPGRIAPGSKLRVNTGIGPVSDPKILRRFQAVVEYARIAQ